MGGEDGTRGDGTGQIGPKPSTGTTACQTPNQPDIPAWMVARNNSVHAPVFGQPSVRKSRKLLSAPVSVSKADTTQPPVVPSQARDMATKPKISPPPPTNPTPYVEMDHINDDQALALLLKNETVAGLLQGAFNTRVLEYQQKLQRAYNQRLVELEDYTRNWRETTKELWSFLSEGSVKPNNDQREALLWNGPRDAGLDFNPELPSAVKPIGNAVINRQSNEPTDSISRADVSAMWLEWATDIRGTADDFLSKPSRGPSKRSKPSKGQVVLRSPHISFVDFAKLMEAAPVCGRIYFRFAGSRQNYEYFSWTGTKHKVNPALKTCDIIAEFSVQNVLLFWKAFCILNDREQCLLARSTRSRSEVTGRSFDKFNDRLVKHYYDFSLFKQHGPVTTESLSLPWKPSNSAFRTLFDGQAEGNHVDRRLVIARPYRVVERVVGAEFFDVGTSTRTDWVPSDIVLTEDTATLQGIGRLLEHALFKDMFPSIKKSQGLVTKIHSSTEFPQGITQETSPKPDSTKSEGCERSTSPERSKPSRACLFQRTIALSDGLKELNGSTSQESPNSQHKHQGLAMGGEPKEVRSPSPTEQKAPVISRRLAHRGDTGIPPIGFANQENREIASDNGGSSDLIMLDGEPMGITAPQREKHSLSPFSQEDSTAKRIRCSATEGSVGHVEQLSPDVSHSSTHRILSVPGLEPPMQARAITQGHLDKLRADQKQFQGGLLHRSDNAYFRGVPENIIRQDGDIDLFEPNLHTFLARGSEEVPTTDEPEHQVFPSSVLLTRPLPLGIQDPVKSSNTIPPSSAITARELYKLQRQLQRLENHLQDNFDHVDEKTVGGEIEAIGRLQIDIKRFEGVLSAQREIEERQEVSEDLRTKPDLSSPDVSNYLKASSNYFNPFSAGPKGAAYGRDILMGQSESTPVDGIPPFSSMNDIPSIEASAAAELPTCTIPTQPKALCGVPTEPRAMRMSMPTLRKPWWQQLAGPRAVSIGPSTQYPGSQVGSSSNSTLRGSLGTPSQVYAGNDCIHADSTSLQSETDRQQSPGAVVSLPPPSCGDERR